MAVNDVVPSVRTAGTAVAQVETMTLGAADAASPVSSGSVLVLSDHATLARQEQFVQDRDRILARSGANGQRAIVALHLVLERHASVATVTEDGQVHLECAECWTGSRPAEERYPCPTAQASAQALDALLF